MKKALIIVLIVTLTILAGQLLPAADYEHSGHKHSSHESQAPGSFVNLYLLKGNVAAGLKLQLFWNIYATGNVQYLDSADDLEFQAGAIYLFPHKILFFRLYGGGGVQMSRNEGYQYPYVVLGTDFLLFFSEVIHPLSKGMQPKFRAGFSFHF